MELGDPLSVTKGVDPVESVPVKEEVRLGDLVRVPDFVPVAVNEEDAVSVLTGVLLKEMDGVTVGVPVIVTVDVIAAVPVPVSVPAAVLLGVWLAV